VMSGFGAYVAAITVRSTVKNRPACGAEQMSPARGLAPMFGNFLCGHVITIRAFLWLREEVGLLGPVAQRTVERPSEPVLTLQGVQCPLSKLKRWATADVSVMPARELRYPVVLVVHVLTAHCSLHELSVPRWTDYACFRLLYPVLAADGDHVAQRTRSDTRLQRASPTGRAGSRRPAGGR